MWRVCAAQHCQHNIHNSTAAQLSRRGNLIPPFFLETKIHHWLIEIECLCCIRCDRGYIWHTLAANCAIICLPSKHSTYRAHIAPNVAGPRDGGMNQNEWDSHKRVTSTKLQLNNFANKQSKLSFFRNIRKREHKRAAKIPTTIGKRKKKSCIKKKKRKKRNTETMCTQRWPHTHQRKTTREKKKDVSHEKHNRNDKYSLCRRQQRFCSSHRAQFTYIHICAPVK